MITPSTARSGRVRRLLTAVAAVALVAVLTGCLSIDQTAGLEELNDDRQAAGLRPLPIQSDAQAKAQAWAEQLARRDSLAHSTLTDGIGVRWCSLGENVGVASTVGDVEAAFMASSVHRTDILSSSWNGVGVGVARNGGNVYVVQEFIKTC